MKNEKLFVINKNISKKNFILIKFKYILAN